MLSLNAIDYTVRQLVAIAFPQSETLSPSIHCSDSVVTVCLNDFSIRFPLWNNQEFEAFLAGDMATFYLEPQIPVFALANAQKPSISYLESELCLEIPYDIISPAFVLLSRYEEYDTTAVDEHGRFPYKGSLAEKYDIVEIPLVDEYALWLRNAVEKYCPGKIPFQSRKPKIVPTHDIDLLYRFKNCFQALRSIFGRDLLINRDFEMVRKSLAEYRAWKRDNFKDPYILSILKFSEMEHAAGHEPVFFFKALNQGEEDASYDIRDTRLSSVWQGLWNEEAVFGLHGSYKSADDVGSLCLERERLESCLSYPKRSVTHARQHFLRAHFAGNLNSLDLWQEAGITDDYTLGFAERCGFRCGTCHPYPLYDVRNDRVTNITEHPLIVMDGTLFDYMKLPVNEAKALALKLKQRCLDVEGDFVILWHNHTTTREFETYYNTVYLPLLTNDY